MSDPRTFGLTPKARDCLNHLRSCDAAGILMPTHAELAKVLHLRSKSGVNRILRQLEERGHIARLSKRPRAIRLCARAPQMTVDVPPALQGRLVQAARAAGHTPDAHIAALIRRHCPDPTPAHPKHVSAVLSAAV